MARLELSRRKDRRWEALCTGCGLCCYERRVTAAGIRVDLKRPCPFLDRETNRCTVYEDRFRSGALCSKVNLLHALFGRLMPLNCGYVRHYRRRLKRSSP